MNQCLDLVLLARDSEAFLLLLIFEPYIFNFLVKFVSPNSSSTTSISSSQRPDKPRTSRLILWTLTGLRKCTPRSSGCYSPFEISFGRPPPVIKKAQGRSPTTNWPGDVPTPPGPGKVFCHIARETWERTPIPLGKWVHPYQPGDEL